MKKVQYIVLQQKKDKFSVDIFSSDPLSNRILPEERNDTAKIREIVHTFPRNSMPTVLRVHISTSNFAEDKLFSFVKANLPRDVEVTKVNYIRNDYVYEVNPGKIIILVTQSRWKSILETFDQTHTANQENAKVLDAIYNLSGNLCLSFVSTIPASKLLPPHCLKQFVKLHTHNEKILPTVQFSHENRKIYQIQDYPRCVLLKLVPNMSLELASKWKHKIMSLFSVMYFTSNKYSTELLPSKECDEFAATLDWEMGTFITNRTYYDTSNYILIAEISEPHLATRWGFAWGCAVVGVSGKVYYGSENTSRINDESISSKCSEFLRAMLTSCWFDDTLPKVSGKSSKHEQYNFTQKLYQHIIHDPIFTLSKQNKQNNYFLENVYRNLCDLVFVKDKKLYVYYGIKDSIKNSIHLTMQPVESFVEFFASALNEGQEAVVTGFISHIATLLFVQQKGINLHEELQ